MRYLTIISFWQHSSLDTKRPVVEGVLAVHDPDGSVPLAPGPEMHVAVRAFRSVEDGRPEHASAPAVGEELTETLPVNAERQTSNERLQRIHCELQRQTSNETPPAKKGVRGLKKTAQQQRAQYLMAKIPTCINKIYDDIYLHGVPRFTDT